MIALRDYAAWPLARGPQQADPVACDSHGLPGDVAGPGGGLNYVVVTTTHTGLRGYRNDVVAWTARGLACGFRGG